MIGNGNRVIGGGNVVIGGGNHVNIGSGNVIGNRPAWDSGGWNRSGWGIGGSWQDQWHNHCINPRYGWYNGCWHGYWGSGWYAPLAWAAVGWGLGSWTSGWGYGTAYYNPYYAAPAATVVAPYDYSQPVVVNNYISSDSDSGGGAPPAPPPTADSQAAQIFDAGLAQFKAGDYRGALASFDAALQKSPGDPVVHEVRALTLFALGDYKPAAAALNSLLSSAPGMDWTTMSSLYGNDDDYTAQLRRLESYCRANPTDAAAEFVLAYHYLTLDAKDAAVKMLKQVVANQPQDATAKRMLDALSPAEPPAPAVAAPDVAAPANAPETDLVGTWQAKAGNVAIELTITADSQFTWKATQPGKPPTELKGDLTSTDDELDLSSKDQGSMAGKVKSGGPNQWTFTLQGEPPSSPGLTFARI